MKGLSTEKKNMKTTNHQALIVDLFSKQAIAFFTAKPIADAKALQLLIDAVGAGPRLEGSHVNYAYPVAVLAATRP